MSEFTTAVHYEFGEAVGDALVRDLVLSRMGERTAAEAIDAGVAPGEVWKALCEARGLDESRWWGPDDDELGL